MLILKCYYKTLLFENENMKDDIECALLRKLARLGYWGGRHTSFDTLPKGFPKHLRNKVKEKAQELIKKHILLSKPTNYGLHVSLNPAKMEEIKRRMLG